MEEISWLIGHTSDSKNTRVYKNSDIVEIAQRTDEFSELDHFQSYAALEAYCLYVVKKYPEDKEFLRLVVGNSGYHAVCIKDQIDDLKRKFDLLTSIDLCNFGRKFLLRMFMV